MNPLIVVLTTGLLLLQFYYKCGGLSLLCFEPSGPLLMEDRLVEKPCFLMEVVMRKTLQWYVVLRKALEWKVVLHKTSHRRRNLHLFQPPSADENYALAATKDQHVI
jgi:hypothetical protein